MAQQESDVSMQPTLRERIGGRWAVSWQGYLLMLPLALVFAVATTEVFLETGNLLWGIGVSLLAYAATGFVQWVAALTVLRSRRVHPVPVWLVAFIGGVSWMARSAVIAVVLQSGDIAPETTVIERLVFGFALGMAIDPIVSWALDNVDRFRTRRQHALQELVDAEIAADRQQVYVEAMRVGLVEQVSTAVGQARSRMDAIDLSSEAMPSEALAVLEEASEQAVRRVSRETWQEGEQRSRLRVIDVMRTAASGRPFSAWAVAVMALFGVVVLARSQGWFEAAVLTAVGALWLLLVISVVNAWRPKASLFVARYILGLFALALVGPIVGLASAFVNPGEPTGGGVILLASVTAVFLAPIFGVARALDASEARALESLSASITRAQVRTGVLAEQEQLLRKEMAIALHGTVGANLTAATMRLRRAIDDGDITRAKNSLFEARRLLDVDLEAVMTSTAGGVESGLRRLADSWDGLVDVELNVDASVQTLSPPGVSAVVDIVTEAVNNAARHGGAHHITIDVSLERAEGCSTSVVVVVTDDGRGSGQQTQGLGSRVFEHYAPGAWSRVRRAEGGCQVTARVTR